jgi:hypothetical protein
MKKVIFSVLAFAAVMASCTSNEELASGTTNVSSSTSTSVAAYVAENYPATTVVSTTASGSTVTATLNTGETLSFTKSGSLLSYSNNATDGIAADSLIIPTDSVGGPGHDGDRDGRGAGHGGRGHGGHGDPGKDQKPDSTHVGGKPKEGHGHPRHFKNEISVDSLSTAINTYISTNYSGYRVIHAEVDTLCQGIVTEVLVCTTKAEPVKLVFDVAGTYLFKAERIQYSDVSTTVSAAVTANFSTYSVRKRAEKFTLTDGSFQYKVFMSLNKVRKTVTFNADGTVSCEK